MEALDDLRESFGERGRLRQTLETWRRDIRRGLEASGMARSYAHEAVRDDEERSADDNTRDLDFSVWEMRADVLAQIDDALQRLHAGSYGRCVECLDEIPPRRLQALPFVRLCRTCQEDAESQRTPPAGTLRRYDVDNA
jgi:RNA polymerase-binding transcription factor DksA